MNIFILLVIFVLAFVTTWGYITEEISLNGVIVSFITIFLIGMYGEKLINWMLF